MTKRQRDAESAHEALRRDFTKDLFTEARLMDSPLLLHMIDQDALTRCRLSQYGQMNSLNRHMIMRTGDYDDMERARDGRVDAAKLEKFADYRQIGLDEKLQEIYFQRYGHGANDSPVPDRPGAPYLCPCGTKFMTGWKTMPLECPRCRRLTPTGQLKRDGYLKA